MRSIVPTLTGALAATALVAALAVAPATPALAAMPSVAAVALPDVPPATEFASPLAPKSYGVSGYYGPRCMPLPGASTFHKGADLAASGGTPIYAIAAGVVTATVDGTSSRDGYISIRHMIDGVEHTSISMHMWSSTTHVKVGDVVAAGQRISSVGTSGMSTGNHLHLELWRATSSGAESLDAMAVLRERGIDLEAGAKAIYATPTPPTCTYYTTGGVNFRSGPGTTYSILRTLPAGTEMVAVPGRSTNSFIPVQIGRQDGWISASLVTPTVPSSTTAPGAPRPLVHGGTPTTAPKPAAPKPAAPKPAAKKTPTYKTTAALNLRAKASMSGKRMLVIPRGASVGVVKGTSGVWRKVTYKGTTGWVHASYLTKR